MRSQFSFFFSQMSFIFQKPKPVFSLSRQHCSLELKGKQKPVLTILMDSKAIRPWWDVNKQIPTQNSFLVEYEMEEVEEDEMEKVHTHTQIRFFFFDQWRIIIIVKKVTALYSKIIKKKYGHCFSSHRNSEISFLSKKKICIFFIVPSGNQQPWTIMRELFFFFFYQTCFLFVLCPYFNILEIFSSSEKQTTQNRSQIFYLQFVCVCCCCCAHICICKKCLLSSSYFLRCFVSIFKVVFWK